MTKMKLCFMTFAAVLWAAQSTAQTTLKRRLVMEEYTGTWCSNCPRGIAAIQHLEKKYGDSFIAISIHQDSYDPMKTKLYASASGYPSCSLSRMGTTDPFFGTSWTQADPIGVIHNIDYVLSQKCYGAVEAQAQWADEGRSMIRVTATSTFATGQKADNFRLAFVVLEDSMHGEGYQWAQANQYVNDTDWLVMPEMEPFVKGQNPQYGMFYNHVAVDGIGIREGIEGSITDIATQNPKTFTTTIDISGNTLIQDKDHLRIVVLLLNKFYGDIENADACGIDGIENGELNIESVSREPGTANSYDLQGRSVRRQAGGGMKRIVIEGDRKVWR